MKTLSTSILMVLGVVVMLKLLPSTLVLGMENSVSVPSARVLNQVMVGRGTPSAVQVRESAWDLRSCIILTGDRVMEELTAKRQIQVN